MDTRKRIYVAGNATEDFVKELENNLKVSAIWHVKDSSLNQTELDFIEQSILACHSVIFVFNEKTRYHRQHASEFLALQKSYEDKCCNIIVVTSGKADIPESLKSIPALNDNVPNFWNELQKRVNNPLSITVGNVAHGLNQNYVYGYLKRIMTDQRDAEGKVIPDSSYPVRFAKGMVEYRKLNGNVHFSDKLIILLPVSCTCKSSLSEYDKNITLLEDIEGKHAKVGQWKALRQPVYKIDRNGKTWIIMVDVPNIMTAIDKLVGQDGVHFTQEHKERQYADFKRHLQESLDMHEAMRGHTLVIEFDDSDPNVRLSELITTAVEKDIPIGTSGSQEEAQYKYDACFIVRKENDDIKNLVKRLEGDNLNVFMSPRDSDLENDMSNTIPEIRSARKSVLWINEENLQDNTEPEMLYQETHNLQERQRRAYLLPIFQGEPHRLSSRYPYLRSHNHLFSKEPDFYTKVKAAITGHTRFMYPLGDIASGMAWAYCKNYLEGALPEYVERYTAHLSDDGLSETFPYFICLTPKSCSAPGKLTDYDSKIERKEKEISWEKMVGGSPRTYNIAINVVRYNGKEYKVMAEFSTPLASLAECELGMKTHMSNIHKLEQKEIYDDQLEQIVRKGTENGTGLRYCKVLRFDDAFHDQTARKGPKFNLSKIIADFVETNKV